MTCLLVIIIYLMDFFYFQRDLESIPRREILYKGSTRVMRALFCAFICKSIVIEVSMFCITVCKVITW